jgi:hypothetical protein
MPSQPTCRLANPTEQIAAQRAAIARFEAALWQDGFNENLLPSYQAAWRRLESLLAQHSAEHRTARHHFVIVIPVADSPTHLKTCLNSLLELCRAYSYGGFNHGCWEKVSVLLADDSGDADIIAKNRAIADEFTQLGVQVDYFGLEEQRALMRTLDDIDLSRIVGQHAPEAYHHKGQGMMRNIAYLQCALLQARQADVPKLFYTLDADQEFKINVATPEGPRNVAAINFFYHLDDIFTRTNAQILTGKVVGDPPVSPAVMAGNFLEDVIGFLHEMSTVAADQPYRQPDLMRSSADGNDAAYHDMADLFGFKQAAEPYRYHCPLPGTPSNAACFAVFARRLNSFFHGEHPTRVTWYQHEKAIDGQQNDLQLSVTPARTVYTGNTVFRPEALPWFIPFAPLRLRMSGPTMGRILKTELGEKFVSANIPMLHKRALEDTGQSEFRPGVLDERDQIDLCGEFERQFHGDVMLFSMQRLTAQGYPSQMPSIEEVERTFRDMQAEMREKFRLKQHALLQRLDVLNTLLNNEAHWWHRHAENAETAEAIQHFRRFIRNIDGNFGAASPCHARLDDPQRLNDWRQRQTVAIQTFPDDQRNWRIALSKLSA